MMISWRDNAEIPGCTQPANNRCNDDDAYQCSGGGRDEPCRCTSCHPHRRVTMTSDIPRRNQIDLYSRAELAIRNAMLAVESMPADVLLTEAVVMLEKAKEKVADYIDSTSRGHATCRCGEPIAFAPSSDEMPAHWVHINRSDRVACPFATPAKQPQPQSIEDATNPVCDPDYVREMLAPPPPEPRFPVGRCKHCGKEVPDAPKDGQTIIFCSYECYCDD